MAPHACHVLWVIRQKAGHYNHDIKCLAAEVNQCTLTKQSSFVLQLLVACWHQCTWALGWHPAAMEALPAEQDQNGSWPALWQRNVQETERSVHVSPSPSTTLLIYVAETNTFYNGYQKCLKSLKMIVGSGQSQKDSSFSGCLHVTWLMHCAAVSTDECMHTDSEDPPELSLALIIAEEVTFQWHSGDLSSTGPTQPCWSDISL